MSEPLDPLAVLESLEHLKAPFAVRVAAWLDPASFTDAYADPPNPTDVDMWVSWVAVVTRIIRAAGVVGARAPREATTLSAVTGLSEGRLLVEMAKTYDHPDVAELLEEWLAQLHARGPDGRPLVENQTDAHAVVVNLTDRTTRRSPTTRRTS